MEKYLPLDHPDLALIKCIQCRYIGTLTRIDIDSALDRLYQDYRLTPEYIFVSEKGLRELTETIAAYYFAGGATLYPTRYREICVVILPTLSEGVFLLGYLDMEQKVLPGGRARLASTTLISRGDV